MRVSQQSDQPLPPLFPLPLQVGILDTDGFYTPLLSFFDAAVAAGFISPASREIVVSAARPAALLDCLAAHVPPPPVVPPSELPPVSVDVLN